LPVAVLTALLAVQTIATAARDERRQLTVSIFRSALIAGAAFGLLTAFVWFAFDLNLLAVWLSNYQNHAGFYDAYDRTYWKWLLVNPVELAFSIGLPAIAALVVSLIQRPAIDLRGPFVPVAIVLGLLWLSGKNSGEAARLWLFLMPWVLWIAASIWQGDERSRHWRAVLVAQALVSLATSLRVSGFGFEDFLGNAG